MEATWLVPTTLLLAPLSQPSCDACGVEQAVHNSIAASAVTNMEDRVVKFVPVITISDQ